MSEAIDPCKTIKTMYQEVVLERDKANDEIKRLREALEKAKSYLENDRFNSRVKNALAEINEGLES